MANKQPKPKLILVSKRGTKVDAWMHCDDCGYRYDLLWSYAKSNRGPVLLCGVCKGLAFNRSFRGKKVDAMYRAVQGGRCDGNRKPR